MTDGRQIMRCPCINLTGRIAGNASIRLVERGRRFSLRHRWLRLESLRPSADFSRLGLTHPRGALPIPESLVF